MYSVLLLLANDFHASRLLLALLRVETHCTGQTSRPPLCTTTFVFSCSSNNPAMAFSFGSRRCSAARSGGRVRYDGVRE